MTGGGAAAAGAAPRHLVAVDLDGTLLGPDKRVSPRTREVLARVVAAGHLVVAVTGRSRWSALELLADVTAIEAVAGANGAYLHRVGDGRLDWSHPVAASEIERWTALTLERFPDASFGREHATGVSYEPRFLRESAAQPGSAERGGAPGAAHDPVFKLYVRTPSAVGGELQRAMRALLGTAAEVSTSGVPFVEATAPGVDKGAALERIAADADVPLTRTVAFGDNLNDLPMLRRAALPVAMGNAVEAVRTEVERRGGRSTAANAEEGVARTLETLLVEGRL